MVAAGVAAGLLAGVGGIVVGSQAMAANQTMAATTAVNIRSSASTNSSIVAVLFAGNKIVATGASKNGWTPVKYNGKTAYVYSKYLLVPGASVSGTQTASPSTMRVSGNVNVRTGPSTGYSVVAVLAKGTSVSLTGSTQGNWAQITYKGSKRWVAAGYLTSYGANLTVKSTGVTTTAADIRSTSAAKYTRIATVAKGTTLELTGVKQNNVVQIVWQGTARWINAAVVKAYSASQPTKPSTSTTTTVTRYTTANLNIRLTSSASSKVVAVAPSGMALQLTGTVQNNMAQVLYNGGKYWASMSYLTTTKPSATAYNGGGSVGLAGLKPYAKGIVSIVRQQYPRIVTFYGVRSDPLPDHPSGHAVDCMLPKGKADNAYGWAIAKYLRANAKTLHIQYIIFDQKIWNISRDSEGWRSMADRGSDTANHKDHVHVTVQD